MSLRAERSLSALTRASDPQTREATQESLRWSLLADPVRTSQTAADGSRTAVSGRVHSLRTTQGLGERLVRGLHQLSLLSLVNTPTLVPPRHHDHACGRSASVHIALSGLDRIAGGCVHQPHDAGGEHPHARRQEVRSRKRSGHRRGDTISGAHR